tara:strand:+ start:8192 stop:9328 length:1137 start_codon:yes stop_codon:yes gene_type:complete
MNEEMKRILAQSLGSLNLNNPPIPPQTDADRAEILKRSNAQAPIMNNQMRNIMDRANVGLLNNYLQSKNNPPPVQQPLPGSPERKNLNGAALMDALDDPNLKDITPSLRKMAGMPVKATTQEEDLKNRPAYSGLLFGQRQADVQKEEGLMGGLASKIFNNPILQRLMQGSLYSRPNFQEGFGGVVQRAAEGEVALRRGEDAQALAQAKVDAAKAKAGDGIPKTDRTMVQQIDRFAKAKGGINLINKMRNLLPSGSIAGTPAKAAQALNDALSLVGWNPKNTTARNVQIIRSKLYSQFEFVGKDLSASDKAIIDTMLPEAGTWLTNANEFLFALEQLEDKFRQEATVSGNILRQGYSRDPNAYIQTAPASVSVSSRRSV